MILLDLPIPPSMNSYWRRGPNRSRAAGPGATVTHVTKEGRQFRKDVSAAWIAQRNRTPLAGPLVVRGWIWFERRGCDTDNRIKPLLDALEAAGVFENDVQVAALEPFRRMDQTMKPGAMIVQIEHDRGCRLSYREVWAMCEAGVIPGRAAIPSQPMSERGEEPVKPWPRG